MQNPQNNITYHHTVNHAFFRGMSALAGGQRLFLLWCLILFSLLFHPASKATEEGKPITIYVQEMGTTYDASIHSFFRKLWAAYSEGAPPHRFRIVPILRKEHMLKEDKSSCVYPATARAMPYILGGAEMLQTRIIGKLNLRAYSNPKAPLIRSWDNMAGKSIVVPRARLTTNMIPGDTHTIVEVPTSESRAIMLLHGRAEVMISTSPFADLILRSKGEKRQLYDPQFLIAEQPLTIICHPSQQNQRLIDAVNHNYLTRVQDGTLAALMAQYDLDYSEFRVDPNRTEPFFNHQPSEDRQHINYTPAYVSKTIQTPPHSQRR